MPIYAYKCESCGHAKDVLQKISAEPLTDCPACGAATFKKQLTAAGFQLKGSGWYATDFRNGGSSAVTGAVAPSATAATSSAASAPAAATDSSGGSTATSPPAACGAACGCH